MLQITNLSAYYDRISALRRVSIHVQEGEIVCLIGANGAGKSTLLNVISGVVPASEGEIKFDGKSIKNLRPDKIVKRGIVQVPEGRQIFPDMTVKENLELGAYLRFKRREKEEISETMENVFEKFPVLAQRKNQHAGTLSGGEQQMLAIGRALMSAPKILLLDEPSMGLAPIVVEQIFDIIRSLRDEGVTILLVEQNARSALSIADRGYVLETGTVILEGLSSELVEDEEVKRAYLGKDYKQIWE
jgi:branched-chain amino acid transport system ATP-binding protein